MVVLVRGYSDHVRIGTPIGQLHAAIVETQIMVFIRTGNYGLAINRTPGRSTEGANDPSVYFERQTTSTVNIPGLTIAAGTYLRSTSVGIGLSSSGFIWAALIAIVLLFCLIWRMLTIHQRDVGTANIGAV